MTLQSKEKMNEKVKAKPTKRYIEIWNRFKKNKMAVFSLFILLLLFISALSAPWLAPYDPNGGNMLKILKAPSSEHLLGTDELGRDIFSRLLYGARVSLEVGFSAIIMALIIGIILGSTAGLSGGIIDDIIMRFMDILLSFPSILLAILLMSVMGGGLFTTVLAICIVSIPGFSRIVRGSVLKIKENEFVEAARSIGCNNIQVVVSHILPNILAPIIINGTMSISTAILYTASLGFLGLGVKPPQAEWGSMLANGQNYIFNASHVILFPGLAIFITVLAFNLFGDGLRDALDPRMNQ